MSTLANEPYGSVDSIEELFAIASEMERAAIDGYSRLADRMRRQNRLDLAGVFDRLVEEESSHLRNVDHWSSAVTGKAPDRSALGWDVGPSFDDEGAGTVAPELLNAYRAFAIAVRNEERAFAFWSYLASRAGSGELRVACEQMALEELGHVATLRRERRRAFHTARGTPTTGAGWTPLTLEHKLADLLRDAGTLETYAEEAGTRAASLSTAPLGDSPLLAYVTADAAERLLPCAELLLECYLDFAERVPSQEDRDRAQTFAAQLLGCLAAVRESAAGQDG